MCENKCFRLIEYHFKAIYPLILQMTKVGSYTLFIVISLPQKLWSRNFFDKYQI